MRNYGKIIAYDGLCGTILSIDNKEYLVLKKDFMYNDIMIGDIVSFISESKNTPTENKLIARFIKKLEEDKK